MTDSSSQGDRPLDLSRGRATVRTLSDKELTELHAQGREALRPGAWEVLDEELRRRARGRVRKPADPETHDERYPALRINVLLLKAAAVVVLLGGVVAIFIIPGASSFLVLILAILMAVSYWAGADLLVLLMDIEANTHAMRRDQE